MKKNLVSIVALALLAMHVVSCQPDPGPQPTTPTTTTNPTTTTVTSNDSLVNYFEQKLIGTWKQQYRIRQTFSSGTSIYDTLAALDTTWTVTFTSNNPVIPSNGNAPYKKDASGKLTEYTDQNPAAYITQWHALAGSSGNGIHTGSIWIAFHNFMPSTIYNNNELHIQVDYSGYYIHYVLKRI